MNKVITKRNFGIVFAFITLLFVSLVPIENLYLQIVIQSIFILTMGVCFFKIPQGFKLPRKTIVRQYLIGLALGIGLIVLAMSIALISGNMEIVRNDSRPYFLLFLLIFVWMLQGFYEEYIFRGVISELLSRIVKPIYVILLSALVFALLHIPNDNITFLPVFNIFLFGVACSLLVYISQSLWIVSSLHFVWNYYQGHVYGVPISGNVVKDSLYISTPSANTLLSGGQFGIEGSIIVTVILTILIFILFFNLKKSKRDIIVEESEEIKSC